MDIYFCPFFEKVESSRPKKFPPLHIEKLPSQTKIFFFRM
uniref:Uncharacterized protein n=1 Tax=viral metagenome TaxID=1070528 RepID=A0A6C0ARV7_9ZZZZ